MRVRGGRAWTMSPDSPLPIEGMSFLAALHASVRDLRAQLSAAKKTLAKLQANEWMITCKRRAMEREVQRLSCVIAAHYSAIQSYESNEDKTDDG